jgi:DNA-binding transcriptional LysR family regulator
MTTIKQMEAIMWVSRLGSFHAAADKLNATQSTISKRVQEFESYFEHPVFFRDKKGASLTPLGRKIIDKIELILTANESILTLGGDNREFVGRYKFGVTEITAMTWLPVLVHDIRAKFPNLMLEPHVDLAMTLFEKFDSRSLDMIIAPEIPSFGSFTCHHLGDIEVDWMCSPTLYDGEDDLPDDFLKRYPLLMHSERTSLDIYLRLDLEQSGLHVQRNVESNSTLALAELAKSGLGLTPLPTEFFRSAVDKGALRILRVKPKPRDLRYVAVFRGNETSVLNKFIAEMASRAFNHVNRKIPG